MMHMEDTDSAEVARLEMHIQARVGGQVRDLHVLVLDNGLVLQGSTHTYYAKQLAQHALMEETSLSVVANEIEVR